jgi:hypothetical protein
MFWCLTLRGWRIRRSAIDLLHHQNLPSLIGLLPRNPGIALRLLDGRAARREGQGLR